MSSTISFYRSDDQLMNDAIDRVVVEIYRKKRETGDKTFLLTGCSSGCGTTTNAINLAIALAIAGWKTVLVDCDLRKGSRFKRLSTETKEGLSDYLSDGRDAEAKDILYPTSYNKLDYIPCGKVAESPIRLLCTEKMEKLLDDLEGKYDYIILDLPSINAVSDANILIPRVDDVVLVLGMNTTTKKQLKLAKDKMAEYEGKYMGLLVNKVEMNEYRKAIKDYDYFKSSNINRRYKKQMQLVRKTKKGKQLEE